MTALSGELSRIDALAADPLRPAYHFMPPSNWMNDPNGPIYYGGGYHLFYQHNPYGDTWGHMHWGHATSRDLVHWEHLPIALYPSHEAGEQHCFSGCAAVDGEGQVLLMYTSVGFERDGIRLPNQQWAALGDADLLAWRKHPANPILSLPAHGGPPIEGDWRDPFIFAEQGRTFLVLGANLAESANVLLYEALDDTLTHWRFRNVLYRRPRPATRFLECPNFFKVDDKWVLLVSPYRNVEYVVGDFDLETLQFHPEQEGVLDAGRGPDPNFYASNILYDAGGRCVLLGWVRGFPPGRGWNGCLALPRLLSIGPDARPRQAPLPELQALRGTVQAIPGATISDSSIPIEGIFPPTLELELILRPGSATAAGIRLAGAGGAPITRVYTTGETLAVQDTIVPCALPAGEPLRLRLFLDHSVLEVFAGDGSVAVTRLVEIDASGVRIELFAEGGSAEVTALNAWPLSLQPRM